MLPCFPPFFPSLKMSIITELKDLPFLYGIFKGIQHHPNSSPTEINGKTSPDFSESPYRLTVALFKNPTHN